MEVIRKTYTGSVHAAGGADGVQFRGATEATLCQMRDRLARKRGWAAGEGAQIEVAVRPHTLLLVGVVLSFLAWALPWGRNVPRGFPHSAPFTVGGSLFLLAWYGFFFMIAWGGFRLGRRLPPLPRAERVSAESFYMYFTVLSVIGVAYSYGYVVVHDPHAVIDGITHQTFNNVRAVLPMSAGIQTLRYATCFAGGIALFEIGKRKFRWVHFLNLGLLVLSAAIAARICIIVAAIVAIGLAARHVQRRRVSVRRVVGTALLGCVALFLVLTPLNYSRNAGTYRDAYGVHNPLLMNAYEMIRYLGMPFQASVAVADHVGTWPKLPRKTAEAGLGTYLLPTYVSSAIPAGVARAELRYRQITTIDASQTTNSVLASAYGVFGLAAFVVLGIVSLGAALIAGHASRYESFVFLLGLVISYCFVEYWRVYAFNAGIVQFLIGSAALWGIIGEVVVARAWRPWNRLSRYALPFRRRQEGRPGPPMS